MVPDITSETETGNGPKKHGKSNVSKEDKIKNSSERCHPEKRTGKRSLCRSYHLYEQEGAQSTEWTPREGRRKKGRPKWRWRDEIEKKEGSGWPQKAQDRKARGVSHPPAVANE